MASVKVAIEWRAAPAEASLQIVRGSLTEGRVVRGEGRLQDGRLYGSPGLPLRLVLSIEAANLAAGANPTLLHIGAAQNSFSFLLRDVTSAHPIFIPAYGVAVTTADDPRSFAQIEDDIRDRALLSNFQRIDLEPEESFEEVARHTRLQTCPIWMGVSRDVRIFEVGPRRPMLVTDYIQPRFHGYGYFGPEQDKNLMPSRYGFVVGRGWECTDEATRRLDEGVLPILRSVRVDDDIRYEWTAFATLERSPLTPQNIRGTHFLVADGLAVCHAFAPEQEQQFQSLRDEELNRDEETVLCCRVVAVNTAAVSRYAFFKAIHPICILYGNPGEYDFDPATGFGKQKEDGLVFGISKLDGRPMPQPEIAVLVPPGQSCTYEFILPHRPITQERAVALSQTDIQSRLSECRTFWRNKLAAASRIHVPEPRIDEMLRAGLLQFDLVTYGNEPDGPLLMSSGTYGPVSSEVWENIQFYDSLGLHDVARRSLQVFLEKQHESGFIQNFTGYMLDTGCVLFGLAEHYRYTRDQQWAETIAPRVIKACQFLVDWRRRNQREDLRGRGYGLMEGKAADPEDDERIYMLNAFAYAGLKGAADLLEKVDPSWARRVNEEADLLREDLRTAFFDSLAKGPAVPLADGTWCPTAAPCVGPSGPSCLFLDGKSWWTHGSMTVRDDILGAIHMISRDVISPDEQAATFILNYSNELMFSRNVASSQPYYLQHPLVHLRRSEAKPFLKAYYNAVAALADRETYSWWEHFFHVSPHKTHETAGFLMQTRHMLWMEQGQTLALLRGIPRAWLESGKRIELRNVASFFGKLSLAVVSELSQGVVRAQITCDAARKPRQVELRIPHPLGQKPASVEGGRYEPEHETIVIEDFSGHADIRVRFEV